MNQGLTSKDALLDVSQVANYLGVSEVTVYRWCRDGRLPCLKIGRGLRIRESALEAFLEGSERSTTLTGQIRSFLRVPDNVLGIGQTQEMLHRLDVAFFRVGEARGAMLAKFYGKNTSPSVDELRAKLESEGLDVARLEDEGRLRFIEESDPPEERVESLRQILTEEAETGRPLWSSFNWMVNVDLDKVLERQEALTQFVSDRQIETMTLITEQEAGDWPPALQRQVQTLHTGMLWISEAGLLTSRLAPLPEISS